MSSDRGVLYIVATPIGNMADISFRAVEILQQVSVIAAEDTRHSRFLLEHHGIKSPLLALHDHNETQVSSQLIERLLSSETIALISDAGTPLLNDPGFQLVRMARDQDIRIAPVPGACALIAALSISGLPTNQFNFVGFPPRRSQVRRDFFAAQGNTSATLIFYESCHRIRESLNDLQAVLSEQRMVVIARELTKQFETVVKVPLGSVTEIFQQDANMSRGEFVVLVQGVLARTDEDNKILEYERVLAILLSACPLKSAVSMAVKMTGGRKKMLYEIALKIKGNRSL